MKEEFNVIIYIDGAFYACYVFDNIIPCIEFLHSFYFDHKEKLDCVQVLIESFNFTEENENE